MPPTNFPHHLTEDHSPFEIECISPIQLPKSVFTSPWFYATYGSQEIHIERIHCPTTGAVTTRTIKVVTYEELQERCRQDIVLLGQGLWERIRYTKEMEKLYGPEWREGEEERARDREREEREMALFMMRAQEQLERVEKPEWWEEFHNHYRIPDGFNIGLDYLTIVGRWWVHFCFGKGG